jgi:hypothetical protein
MAIARDNSNASAILSANSISYSYTVNNNTNGLLLAFFMMNGTDATTAMTGATYNGVTMTSLGQYNKSIAGVGNAIDVFYLLSPASGTHTFAATSSGTTIRKAIVASYTGVKQSNPPDAVGTNSPVLDTGSVTSETETIVPVAANAWGIMISTNSNAATVSAGANTSVVVAGSEGFTLLDTNAAQNGSFTMVETAVSTRFASSFFSIAPFGVSAIANPAFLLKMI